MSPLLLLLLPSSLVPSARLRAVPSRSGGAPIATLFDGVKDAFGGGDKPIVAADRVTPFDRWLGLDKGLEAEAEAGEAGQSVTYVDPSDVKNYLTIELSKPMGIAFVENEGECGGIYVDDLLPDGSAASATPALARRDQLVAVDSQLVLGQDFDTALGAIQNSGGQTTKLVFFRGPTSFLYGPTKASAEWYQENLLQVNQRAPARELPLQWDLISLVRADIELQRSESSALLMPVLMRAIESSI